MAGQFNVLYRFNRHEGHEALDSTVRPLGEALAHAMEHLALALGAGFLILPLYAYFFVDASSLNLAQGGLR